MDQMPAVPHFRVAYQYVKRVNFDTNLRPYEAKGQLASQVELELGLQELEHAHHHRVTLRVTVSGALVDGTPVYSADAEVEGIVAVSPSLSAQEVEETLRTEVAAILLGHLRTLVMTSSLGSGFPPISLPLLSTVALGNLPVTRLTSLASRAAESSPTET